MSEYPKEVHPEDSGAAGLSIKEMAPKYRSISNMI